jgi:NAD+ diphosphatase
LDRRVSARADGAEIAALHAAPDARFLLFIDGKCAILSSADRSLASIRWFDAGALAALGIASHDALFLGLDPEGRGGRFAVALASEQAARHADALRPAVDLRSLALQGVMSADELSLLAQAKSLADWNETHGFCGKCGAPAESTDGGWKRVCTSCGRETFPRIDPVVIMLVTDGERCVLAREARFPPGMHSAIAGFIEPGDDLEHAVRRETKEEIGLDVEDVRYQLSQPWPFPHSLMLGCLAIAKFKDLRIDTAELEAARWFGRDEVAAMLEGRHADALTLPGPHAIANTLVRRWLAHPSLAC